MPYTTSVAGTTITASWANANVRDQVVTPFASTGARDAAITAPVAGMLAVTTDTGTVWRYTGTGWVPHLGQICTSGTRPTGYSGLEIWETDTLRLLRHDGTGWVILAEPTQSWVPTFAAGVTVGNGSWSFNRYHRSDGWVDFRGRFVWGSTSSITADVRLNLPIASLDILAPGQFSFGFYRPSTGAQLPGIVGTDGTTGSVFLRGVDTSSTYATSVQMSNTVPFSWTSGDLFDISGRYQMTTRYS